MVDERADHEHAGFRERTRLADARERLRAAVEPHGRTETVTLEAADGRVLAASVAADRDVPHYRRAAMDGYAVRAGDTFGAGDRSPERLRVVDGGDGEGEAARGNGPDEAAHEIGPGEAVRVHTGSALPDGADAVVMIEHVEHPGGGPDGGPIEVFDAVAEGENVAPVGEDVEAGQHLYEPGHRLRPSDLGLLRSIGIDEIRVADRPSVAVVPTGEELVAADPAPGEVVETNGLTVSRLVERWGGSAAYRDVVTDDPAALRAVIERDRDHDLVVTTGGSSVGERDLLPDVLDDLGEVLVHGVALKPGHPVGFGAVEGTPVLMLPGYPVSCIVTAVQLLRPALSWLAGAEPPRLPRTRATLARKIGSEPGVRTFARVTLERTEDDPPADRSDDAPPAGRSDDPPTDGTDDGWTASPTRTSGAGVLSSVALADGWVVVPESRDGIPAGERVAVQDWEWSP